MEALIGLGIIGFMLYCFGAAGGSPSSVTKTYRVHGSDTYTLKYTKSGGKYTIYCTRRPRNSRSSDVNDCHIYSSGEVCVSVGNEPRTLDQAKAIGMAWMNGYSRYIRSGYFPNSGSRVHV